VAKATQLSSTEAGAIYVFDDSEQEFHLRATYGLEDATAAALRERHIRMGEGAMGAAALRRMPFQVPTFRAIHQVQSISSSVPAFALCSLCRFSAPTRSSAHLSYDAGSLVNFPRVQLSYFRLSARNRFWA
jgi:hypothetical protein